MDISIYNKVEDKIIFTGNDDQFVSFMQGIVKENEDYDFSILGISDAIEYLEDFCSNLEMFEQLYEIKETQSGNLIESNLLHYEAVEHIKEFEEDDKLQEIYIDDFYEIVPMIFKKD